MEKVSKFLINRINFRNKRISYYNIEKNDYIMLHLKFYLYLYNINKNIKILSKWSALHVWLSPILRSVNDNNGTESKNDRYSFLFNPTECNILRKYLYQKYFRNRKIWLLIDVY